MHEVLVNRLEGLGLPRKSPDMVLDVYRGRKTTTTIESHCILGTADESRSPSLSIAALFFPYSKKIPISCWVDRGFQLSHGEDFTVTSCTIMELL